MTTHVAQQFSATVTGVGDSSVNWSVDGVAGGNAAVGTISAMGCIPHPAPPARISSWPRVLQIQVAAPRPPLRSPTSAGVTTQRYAVERTGLNFSELALTPAVLATPGAFGKLFSCAVDGPIYAQPLWVANLAIGGGTHNVVFVVTQHATVYAFDADAAPCRQYWKVSLLPAGETPVPAADTGETGDVPGEFGITGTPVIDLTRGTLYAVATSKAAGPAYWYRLHALEHRDRQPKGRITRGHRCHGGRGGVRPALPHAAPRPAAWPTTPSTSPSVRMATSSRTPAGCWVTTRPP